MFRFGGKKKKNDHQIPANSTDSAKVDKSLFFFAQNICGA